MRPRSGGSSKRKDLRKAKSLYYFANRCACIVGRLLALLTASMSEQSGHTKYTPANISATAAFEELSRHGCILLAYGGSCAWEVLKLESISAEVTLASELAYPRPRRPRDSVLKPYSSAISPSP